MSHDFEDIIYVIDNNLELYEDIIRAEKDVQSFLIEMSRNILTHPSGNEIIECHLNPYTVGERKDWVVKKRKQIAELR